MKTSAAAVVVAGTLLALGLTAAAGAQSKAFVSFRTPSKNIYCMYGSGELRCDIGSGLRPKPPKPRNCQFDWGGSVNMRRTGRARVGCVSDSVYSSNARVLRYGKTWRGGGFACTSRIMGLTCRNASRHGWFLSRQRSRVF
ncbi:MAG: hypothetical protein M3R70_05170 [Actinomycetota bacterium]|nr:hypothetical protein [Actinomycetota bacterium]